MHTQDKTSELDLRQAVLRIASVRLKESGRVLIEAATGVGKTKIALELAEKIGAKYAIAIVPTDAVGQAWEAECVKWNVPFKLTTVNYLSTHKLLRPGVKNPDIIILDEAHHITDRNLTFLLKLKSPLIALSATVDYEKLKLLQQLGFDREITVTLDQAQEQELVAPYELNMLFFAPDDRNHNIEAGGKKKRWMSTEVKQLEYLNKQINQAKASGNENYIQFCYMNRMRFIRTLPSRTRLAKRLITYLQGKYPQSRILVFAGDIATCEDLVPQCYYHSKGSDEGFERFKAGNSNILGSVNALSEGINVHADIAIICASMSKERHTIQRLGRLLRKTAEGKMGRAFVLVARGTQDEVWAGGSVEGLSNVKKYNIEQFKPLTDQ